MAQGRSTKIISMIKWIWTSRLTMKNSLRLGLKGYLAMLGIQFGRYSLFPPLLLLRGYSCMFGLIQMFTVLSGLVRFFSDLLGLVRFGLTRTAIIQGLGFMGYPAILGIQFGRRSLAFHSTLPEACVFGVRGSWFGVRGSGFLGIQSRVGWPK